MSEQELAGGVGNEGLVVRVGDTVRRPWHPSTEATHELLNHLAEVLPGTAPIPLGRDDHGREVLSWIEGEVAIPPFPIWVTDPDFLVSLGRLVRQIHDALESWTPPQDLLWAAELADPHSGSIVAHADICPENVITRDGQAVAIIDWEFAAPGRRIWDVVSTARLCVPFTAPSRRDPVYQECDVTERLGRLLEAYGLDDDDRAIFTEVLEERRAAGERFIRGRLARGDRAFIDRWDNPEGRSRLLLERSWISAVPTAVAQR